MSAMRKATLLVLAAAAFASRPPDLPFDKHTLDLGASETAGVADVNNDGKPDIISGEFWYEGPAWKPHRFRELGFQNNYIDDFSDLPIDADGDGHVDIVSCSWFSKRLSFWKNPGKGKGGLWTSSDMQTGHSIEFCFLVDLDNDGKAREVLPQFGGAAMPLSWYEYKDGGWKRHQVSEKSWGHGIGAGDVNKDGRADVLVPSGWFEAPADPRSGAWTWHPDFESFGMKSTGFLHVLDVDQDGRNDVITGLAHDYGIFFLRNAGDGKFQKQLIDDSWSQPHATTIVDLNKDGRPDLLTGKRYMAHNGKDPGEREPLGVYWYEWVKSADGKKMDFVRHIIDFGTRAGGGMQLAASDVDGDGDIDVVAPGKAGLFLFVNKTR